MLAAIRADDLGLSALVLEKSDLYGGTTSTSGGALWIPLNGQVPDDYDDAYTYLKAAVGDTSTDGKVRAYLESGKDMVRFINEKTSVRYHVSHGYADYYQELPGAVPQGRAMEPVPFNGALLGEEFQRLRPTHPAATVMGIGVTIPESNAMATKKPGWIWTTLKVIGRYALDLPWRFRTRRDRRLCLGSALIGGLRHTMIRRNIPLWLDCPMESLVVDRGRIIGVMARKDGRTVTLRARRGVILAAGGFERNQQMRDQYLPQPSLAEWSCTPKGHNTGDGIRAAAAIGAKLGHMSMTWGAPTVRAPKVEQGAQAVFAERGAGGCIVVNRQGRRFVNESISYDRFQEAMYAEHTRNGGAIPAWFVFDAKFRKTSPLGPLLPSNAMPDSRVPKEWFGDFVFKANTLEELARQMGVDPAGLADSVGRNNQYADTGVDLDFHRGENAYDTYWAVHGVAPNPCLVSIDTAPYYGMKMTPGDTGTKGGPVTTDDGQAVDEAGAPIPGLYAIGNCSAAVLGRAYAGAGCTIGPGMVFAFRAVNHIAGS
ncbi:MAG: FAD-binding protein [Rhodocyclales bacterium]|nr:FAD-binding protein [Rhodocyclales bacterium]